MAQEKEAPRPEQGEKSFSAPTISLPKGGGAIRGIGEKFAANPVTGTGSIAVPIATSPGRSGFGPQLSLSYDSGAGNGPFGFGWSLSLPAITRKTDKGLPLYRDGEESDVFILSGAEDLVPVLTKIGEEWQRCPSERTINGTAYRVERYRPRIEGLFARIERWTNLGTGEIHWRSITRDNVTTLYGKDNNSRIFDPNDPDPNRPRRIFSWLICESYDDKGNALVYEYAEENSDGVDAAQAHERNRTSLSRSANRYPKRIKYGNRVSRLMQPDLSQTDWMFEVVFDYGEHDPDSPTPKDAGARLCRHDPFSVHRAGFEVRTYRLCRRVLMFHHFPAEEGVGRDCLVRSTDLAYRNTRNNAEDVKKGHPIASFVAAITQSGYKRKANGYLKKSLPPIEFEYSEAVISGDVKEVDAESVENLPSGLDGARYQWVDLDGEGLSGIMTEQGGAWFYKRNVSSLPVIGPDGKPTVAARFAPMEKVATLPSSRNLAGGQQLLDLAGDGQLDVVDLDGPVPGFYERTDDGTWSSFVPFSSLPNIPWKDPSLKFVDLNGDGHADILIAEEDVFTRYPSLAEKGFGPAEETRQALNEEEGPRLVFVDGTQSVYLADISGDGLSDLVRIRNGEVCYWPNLGYGRFGPKVTMDNAPVFDAPDQFEQRRIRLGDIDGSGTTDIIYLGRDSIDIYFNQAGNGWGTVERLTTFPKVDNLSSVMAVDLLGNGTACLVWSSPLPGNERRSMRYIDLMGGQKPHLVTRIVNNLGAETHVRYAPSTKFYLADRIAGRPWVTRLPFPVHVVERVDTYDRISRNRFVTRYAYHHGYFDGIEREFRGFGMIEQWDTDEFAALGADDAFPAATNIEEASHVPPILTKTWFHAGAYLQAGRISRYFEDEYYRESDASGQGFGLSDGRVRAMLIDDTVLPETIRLAEGMRAPYSLSAEEAREACRALKGSILRQEIYGLDGAAGEGRPYSVSERNYTIELLQPRGPNQCLVFFTHARETVDFHYERKLYEVGGQALADPRVSHAMTLSTDDCGNVLQSVAIGYGRRFDDPDPLLTTEDRRKQKTSLLTFSENQYTNTVLEDDDYCSPQPCEIRTYELINVIPASNEPLVTNLFRFDEMLSKTQAAGDGQHDIPYEDVKATNALGGVPWRRIIEHLRTLYRRDDLNGALPMGRVQSRMLPYASYKLALTAGLLATVYKRKRNGGEEELLPDPVSVLRNEGRYVRSKDHKALGLFPNSDPDDSWWIPSGQIFYSPGINDTFPQELARARQHFFMACRFQDPFGETSAATYDVYDLLTLDTVDALGNRFTAGERDQAGNLVKSSNDYRVFKPGMVMEPNRNRSAVAFDAMGMVAGTAVMGKPEENLGDSLEDFEADLDETTTIAHIQDPLGNPHGILKKATTRLVYDLSAYYRTQTNQQPQPGVVYSLAREAHESDLPPGQQTKIQHGITYSDGFGREIQKKIQAEPGPVVEGGPDFNPRWVGSGWKVFNNKGKSVREYEPFFSATHRFEFARAVGVSSVLLYDPVDRLVATLHPNRTYEKVVFDPWRQANWDVSDTVLQADPKNDPDVGDFFRRMPDGEYLPSWHALRQGGALGSNEQAAAAKAAVHANTPTRAYLDALGRTFLTAVHNRFDRGGVAVEEMYATRVNRDIEDNQREAIDALNRASARYDYDMLGNRIHQTSMEAGERWTLNTVTGNVLYTWNSRGHRLRTVYDQLRRPAKLLLREGNNPELLVEHTLYGESQSDSEIRNLRGRICTTFDQAGIVTSDAYDFKGNLLSSSRQLAGAYRIVLDWAGTVPPPLEASIYTSRTRYDALNRAIQLITPHSNQTGTKVSFVQPRYNEANLLERALVWLNQSVEPNDLLDPATANLIAVADIDYNAKGQRTLTEYGNGVRTKYEYDPQTFHLTRLLTVRDPVAFPGDCPKPPMSGWPGCEVQNLRYTYDPMGNITHVHDEAQQTVYFRNRRVEPSADYVYDAIYRLISATGREHLGQIGGQGNPPRPSDAFDSFRAGLEHPGDGNAMGAYLEEYVYDAVGNILTMQHRGGDPANPGWTRVYTYGETSQLEAGKTNNRLSNTTIGTTVETCRYDEPDGLHGNITAMAHLPLMKWNYQDRLGAAASQIVNNGGTPETTYYVYDPGGQRVRKVTDRQTAAGQSPIRKSERVYLAGFEIYREFGMDGSTVALERETLHVADDKQRIALVEARTRGTDPGPTQLIRYQFGNNLGSASLELDDTARVISYEEYYPYGSSSYQAVRSQVETPKRYRYTGKERDTESGFYYYGARFYAPWLGRWTSCDTAGALDGFGLYAYVRDNPVRFQDLNGMEEACGVWDLDAQVCRQEPCSLVNLMDPVTPVMPEPAAAPPPNVRVIPKSNPQRSGSAPPRPTPSVAPSMNRELSPPPPVSPPDYTLYVREGLAYTSFQDAAREVDNPDNPWYVRGGMFALGCAVAPLAVAEELVRSAVNTPFLVHNVGTKIGEHSARSYLWAEQGETGEAVVDGLSAVEYTAVGFLVLGSVAEPFAGRPAAGAKPGVAKPRIHGNDIRSTKPQHVYEIYETGSGDVVKTGISGRPLTKGGTSPRATSQVNKLNKAEGAGKYDHRVVKQSVPNRREALEAERANAQRLWEEGNSMRIHKRPRPWD